jgi:flagellar hook assembly protein FlgD
LSPTFSQSPTLSTTPSISPSFSQSPTLAPSATAEVPVVTNKNFFNPGNGEVLTINLKAVKDGAVNVRVYNVAGELVRLPFDAYAPAGRWFQATWDGKNDQGEAVASGVYFISVRGAGVKGIKKVIVLK